MTDEAATAFFDPVLRDFCIALMPSETLAVDEFVYRAIVEPTFLDRSRFGSDADAKGPAQFFSERRAKERASLLTLKRLPRLIHLDDPRPRRLENVSRVFVLAAQDELRHVADLRDSLSPQLEVTSVKNDVHPALMLPVPFDEALATTERPKSSDIRLLVILAVPRSGSYMLAELLANQGLGTAEEHVKEHLGAIARNRGSNNFSFIRWFEGLKRFAVTPTGWVATKLMSHYFERLDDGLTDEEVEYLRSELKNALVVQISRQDRVLQAVSGYRSMVTKTYRIRQAAQERNYREQEFLYDFMSIQERLEWTNHQYAKLQALIDRYEVEPIQIGYEQLVEDPSSSIRRIMSAAEIPFDSQRLTLQRNLRMRDDLSLEYARRFREESER